MSSDGSDSEVQEQDLPTAAECEERCQRFAEVTGTDTALAMFFLQDRQWNLDKALNAFFEQNGGSGDMAGAGIKVESSAPASLSEQQPTAQWVQTGRLTHCQLDLTSSTHHGEEKTGASTSVADPEPHRIRVLSWNIDGLEEAHLKQRTRTVIETIKKEKAEVVLLQEVVGRSEAMLREGLGDYRVVCGGTATRDGYYTAVLLHKSRAMLDDTDIMPFHSTMMGRNLLVINCCVKGVPMTVMTSHLESTKSHAAERKRQLQTAFKRMKDAPPDRTVLFGGDLNLRDKEVRTRDGKTHGCKFAMVVNCAGPWAGEVARKAGVGASDMFELYTPLPVEPRKRYVYVVHCPTGPTLDCPLLVDPTGVYFRREGFGGHYLCGTSPPKDKEPSIENLDVDYDLFSDQVWPVLANRVPAFEALKVKSAWAGYYDYNIVDQNLIIGNHPYHRNFFFANGLSGHGLQHSVAVGRAIMELIVDGGYKTIDLSRFGFERFLTEDFLEEDGIV